jgi:hypothetical protein
MTEQQCKLAVDLLVDLTASETEPCSFDHHGYCQEHNWFETDPPCPYPRAHKLLDELGYGER